MIRNLLYGRAAESKPEFDADGYKRLLKDTPLSPGDYFRLRKMNPLETYYAIQDTVDPDNPIIDVKSSTELKSVCDQWKDIYWGYLNYIGPIGPYRDEFWYKTRSNMSVFGQLTSGNTDPNIRVIDVKDYNKCVYRTNRTRE